MPKSLCSDCGAKLGDLPINPDEPREPCPKCGSTLRTALITGAAHLKFSVTGTLVDANAPGLLLQAVVTLGPKVKDGNLIAAVGPVWCEIAKLIEADPGVMYQIDERKWEELLAGWYKQHGFDEVVLTPRSGDRGRDVIAVKHGVLSVKILDQMKKYKPGHRVPADDVRALYGVLAADQSASKGLVTTTSVFAPGVAKEFAPMIPTRLELVDGPELVKRLAAEANK